MKQYYFALILVIVLAGCGDNTSGNNQENDSASTAPITDPSYNPETEADSATKQMNLDSSQLKDSPVQR
jgi:hypothetical protein